jgi:hypothetical protein
VAGSAYTVHLYPNPTAPPDPCILSHRREKPVTAKPHLRENPAWTWTGGATALAEGGRVSTQPGVGVGMSDFAAMYRFPATDLIRLYIGSVCPNAPRVYFNSGKTGSGKTSPGVGAAARAFAPPPPPRVPWWRCAREGPAMQLDIASSVGFQEGPQSSIGASGAPHERRERAPRRTPWRAAAGSPWAARWSAPARGAVSKWGCLSTAGGAPPLRYPAGCVV